MVAAVMTLDQATALFCLAVALAVGRTLPKLVEFYAWFKDCGLEISKHRGYGQTASKAFGVLPAPKLSVPAMALSGVGFVGCMMTLALVTLPEHASVALLCLSLVLYHLFFTQLYCEAHVGAHVTVMIPPALILLALSAGRVGGSDPLSSEERAQRVKAGEYTAWLCKIVLTSAYCSAGISKLWTTLTSRSWLNGFTLQAFIYEASLITDESAHSSFGVPTPYTAKLQRLFMSCPRLLLAPMSVGAVAFETLAPLILLAPPALVGAPFAVFGVKFHYGICLLQRIDFVSWWGPMYAFFLVATPESEGILAAFPATAAASFELAPVSTALAGAYVVAHLVACFVLRFYPSIEVLPFSCFPMFKNAVDLFDPACRKWHWLTDKEHATGTLKNYCFPFGRPQHVLESEFHLLPFKYCLIGHGGGVPPRVMTNATLTPALSAAIDAMRAASSCGRGSGATDPDALPTLLGALAEAKVAFAAAPRASRASRLKEEPQGDRDLKEERPAARANEPEVLPTMSTAEALRRRVGPVAAA